MAISVIIVFSIPVGEELKTVEIKTDDYAIWYEPESSTVFFRGFLRLDGMEEYRPVMDLLM